MNKLLERTEAIIRGEAPAHAIAKLIGFDLISVAPGKAVVELQATEAHANPMGTLHGGVLCDISDAAMGIASASNLDEGESFTTLELKISFLKPVWKARCWPPRAWSNSAVQWGWLNATSPMKKIAP
jgi:acyl-coenzyme A thioesterase PaaI-like protein